MPPWCPLRGDRGDAGPGEDAMLPGPELWSPLPLTTLSAGPWSPPAGTEPKRTKHTRALTRFNRFYPFVV
eukprot:8366719-Pyramimonas_sp.AAC.1